MRRSVVRAWEPCAGAARSYGEPYTWDGRGGNRCARAAVRFACCIFNLRRACTRTMLPPQPRRDTP